MKPRPLLTPIAGGARPDTSIDEPHVAYADAQRHRDVVAGRYDEAIGFTYPGRAGMMSSPDASQVYDSTVVTAAQEFASRVQAGVCPNFARFAKHVAGNLVEDDDAREEVDALLEEVDTFMFDLVHTSNFQVEANEFFQDLSIGTAGFQVDERDETNPLSCSAIPLSELSFNVGPDGIPDPIARTRKMKARAIRVNYPLATLPRDIDTGADLKIVEIWQRDWSEPAAHRYRCTLFMPDKSNMVLWQYDVSGIGSCKMFVTRWSKASGEVWGRGPVFNCLPDIRILNFAIKAVIDHADMALAGIWSAEDDGVFNPETARLEPGILLPRAPGSAPLQNVAPGGSFDIQQFLISEHRANVKKALFTEQLGNPNKTPMTATEVDQRMAELARAIGSPFGRIVLEFVMPFVARAIYILKGRKLIVLPEVDGKEVKFLATSPLAESQKFEDVDRTTKYVATIGQLFGPETASLTIDATETSIYLAERIGVPKRIVRSRAKQKELAAQIAEQASAAGGMNGEATEAGPDAAAA